MQQRQTTMQTISINYSLKWQYDPLPYYKWSKCGKLFNCRTGKQIKKTMNGGSIGYWIAGKFITLETLKSQLSKIQYDYSPF